MPKRTDLKSVLVIGSGPIVIGQAAEFDYSGTQAIRVLKEEGVRVVLVNSNPATIMTDPELADATYVEPITPAVVAKIIEKERPDALLPTLGGQTALNTAIALDKDGVLERFGVDLDGAIVCVIGRGVTVGRPISLMLTSRDVNATDVLCHTGTKDLAAETRRADVVIAAAGKPHMITADMIKEGAALLDVGVSRVDGKLTGDIHPDCWDKAGFVSPNPGGVGPLTRAFLVRNIVERAEKLA